MNTDEILDSLRDRPRPRLGPFFAARASQRAAADQRVRARGSWLLTIYWIAFALFAATLLLPTPVGIPLAILVVIAAALRDHIGAWLVVIISRIE